MFNEICTRARLLDGGLTKRDAKCLRIGVFYKHTDLFGILRWLSHEFGRDDTGDATSDLRDVARHGIKFILESDAFIRFWYPASVEKDFREFRYLRIVDNVGPGGLEFIFD